MIVQPSSALPDLLPRVQEVCAAAGELALELFRPGAKTAARIWSKAGGSPVTEADIAVDDFLRRRLGELLPEAGWLSEETVDDHQRLSRRLVWIVDPIDGTRAYMSGSPDWAVCVALLVDGIAWLGVVHAPACGASYSAHRGGGAFRNGRTIATTRTAALRGARIAGPKPMLDALATIESFEAVPKIPSLALRLARIAEGVIDGALISPDARDWDLAAADLILSEAGGQLSDGAGDPVKYNRENPRHGVLAASTRPLAGALLTALRRLRETGS